MLKIENLRAGYGRNTVLEDINLSVNEGEIVTLIGANGAGKSTLLLTISGVVKAQQGRILLDDTPITCLNPPTIARLRLAHAPEGRRIFGRLTVRENLLLGATVTNGKTTKQDMEWLLGLFPRLGERLEQRGGTLSGGEQQMLAIARALMSKPRLLLLDEPSLGLAPLIAKQIFEIITAVSLHQKLAVLLVEQNASAALKIAQRGYVLQKGRIVLSGDSAALLVNPEIRSAYLGGH
ncbi:MAG: ABC transporter ATP-binding protein [Holosporales bacterium]|jgi:branched-chain amino acid transport system ATP-binding protein